jgi:hypothetical protein
MSGYTTGGMAGSATNGIDHEYWLAHGEGFQVRDGRRRLGFVDQVLDGGRTLSVRGGFLDRRVVHIPVTDVFAVLPRDMRIWLHTATRTAQPRVVSPLLTDELESAVRRRTTKIAA